MQIKHKKLKKEKVFEKVEIKDLADSVWKKILFTIMIFLLIGTLGAVFLFTYISGIFDDSLADEANISSLILDRGNLNEALTFSEEKSTSLETAKQTLPQTIDPSDVNSYSLEQLN